MVTADGTAQGGDRGRPLTRPATSPVFLRQEELRRHLTGTRKGAADTGGNIRMGQESASTISAAAATVVTLLAIVVSSARCCLRCRDYRAAAQAVWIVMGISLVPSFAYGTNMPLTFDHHQRQRPLAKVIAAGYQGGGPAVRVRGLAQTALNYGYARVSSRPDRRLARLGHRDRRPRPGTESGRGSGADRHVITGTLSCPGRCGQPFAAWRI